MFRKIFRHLKLNFIIYVFLALVAVLIYFAVGIFYYLDLPVCVIRIEHDVLRGNKQTIKQAMRMLRMDDPVAYMTVCHYVDTISEKYCFANDYHIYQAEYREDIEKDGCFVRGSRTIYLRPEKDDSREATIKRAQNIYRYSQYSQWFWDNYTEY